MRRCYLLWKFVPANDQDDNNIVLSNDKKDPENDKIVTNDVIDAVTIEKSCTTSITFKICVHK